MSAATDRDTALLCHPMVPPLTVAMAAALLDHSDTEAARLLAGLEQAGSMRRTRHGVWKPAGRRPVRPLDLADLLSGLARVADHLNGCALEHNAAVEQAWGRGDPDEAGRAFAEALDWFDARPHADALLRCAPAIADEEHFRRIVIEAAEEWAHYLTVAGRWQDAAHLATAGLRAAERRNCAASADRCRNSLAYAYWAGGDDDSAEQALGFNDP
ncbi:hypothetical protein [Nocardiopsis baichengensis]|uniref:hypothetical protein n=1 Tax=Nocardiopsis baichengensis TaxID=280240 RepID=UPI0003477BBF|nr:hypothetical protein [Nocardiopsis baichengensis]